MKESGLITSRQAAEILGMTYGTFRVYLNKKKFNLTSFRGRNNYRNYYYLEEVIALAKIIRPGLKVFYGAINRENRLHPVAYTKENHAERISSILNEIRGYRVCMVIELPDEV